MLKTNNFEFWNYFQEKTKIFPNGIKKWKTENNLCDVGKTGKPIKSVNFAFLLKYFDEPVKINPKFSPGIERISSQWIKISHCSTIFSTKCWNFGGFSIIFELFSRISTFSEMLPHPLNHVLGSKRGDVKGGVNIFNFKPPLNFHCTKEACITLYQNSRVTALIRKLPLFLDKGTDAEKE